MRNFIYLLMTDKLRGKVFIPFKLILYALSLVYGIIIFFRMIFYKFGIFKSNTAPLRIISVGNITLGGTGKTPFVISLARLLKDDMAREACVLIRGYGWDEQAMLKKSLADVPILVGEYRLRSAHRAIKLYGSDTAILDDGFQHWELRRDLDIVLIDSRNPFGNGRLFPRGILRERKFALKRAGIIVFTKSDKNLSDVSFLKEEIKMINPKALYLEARHKPKHIYDIKTKKIYELTYLRGKKVALLSSIGDPDYFSQTIGGLGAHVVKYFVFEDHHDYKEADIGEVTRACGRPEFGAIVTTEKDAVKLNRLGLSMGDCQLLVLTIEMEIVSGRENLIDRLNSLYTR